MDFLPGVEISSNNDTFSARIGHDLGSITNANPSIGATVINENISKNNHVSFYLSALNSVEIPSNEDSDGIITSGIRIGMGEARKRWVTLPRISVGASGFAVAVSKIHITGERSGRKRGDKNKKKKQEDGWLSHLPRRSQRRNERKRD